MSKQYFAVQQADRAADIYIFGDLVPFEWFDGDVSANGIRRQIEGLDVDEIRVHIDSYGGAVSEGWAIYNALMHHPARVTSYGDGFVASAALFPFLAGDERIASNLSAYYLHQVMVSAEGYARDLRAAADEADLMTDVGISAFVERTGMSAEDVRALMEAETWLSPDRALELGIATSMVADRSVPVAQAAKRTIMQRVLASTAVSAEDLMVPGSLWTPSASAAPADPGPAPAPEPPAEPQQKNPINPIMKLFERRDV